MTLAVFLGVMILLASNTPIGRLSRHWLIDRPAARLARVTPGQLCLVVILAFGVGLVLWFGGREGVSVLGMGMPDVAASFGALEIGAYLDAAIAVAATASLIRLRGVRSVVVAAALRIAGRAGRARRTRRRPVDQRADNDDERPFLLTAA